MLEKLMASPISWTVLAVVTIASLILAIVFYLKSKEKKAFSYCLRSSSLIRRKKRKLEKLSVTYNGRQIDNLCVSRFTIWNSGNTTLNNNDMVVSKELTITADDESTLLDVELIACSEETNKFSVQLIDEHTAKVLFDYADKREGVVIQILHTGNGDSLQIKCKIKGGMPIANFVNEIIPTNHESNTGGSSLEKFNAVSTGVMVILWFFLAIIYTMNSFGISVDAMLFPKKVVNEMATSGAWKTKVNIGMAICYWVLTIGGILLSQSNIKTAFNLGMPKTLKKHSQFGI